MSEQVTIAIDYDGTFTKIPRLLTQFIKSAQESGHRVICVTLRHESEGDEIRRSTLGRMCRIIFTNRRAKEPVLKELGITPDIWIDDQPFWIYKDATPIACPQKEE